MIQANLRLSSRHHTGIQVAFTSCRSLSRKHAVVRANWGAPVQFSKAKVLHNKQVFPGMHQIVVDVGAAVAAGYTAPGQYLQAKVAVESKPGFFAIASAPGLASAGANGSSLEFLIKSQPGASAGDIAALASGGDIMVSPAQGKGFPIHKIPLADVDIVLMFATGSGVSPIKAVIESNLLESSKRKHVHLFYGTKNQELTAYQDQISAWEAAGVKVTQVFSGDGKQYVQTALEAALKSGLIPAGSEGRVGVLLCGHKDMCTAVSTVLTELGVSKDNILLNF